MANTGGRAVRPIAAPALLWYSALLELAIGALMAISSELFEADVYRLINQQLEPVAVIFLFCGGAALLALSGFWPKRLLVVVPFLALVPPAILATNFLQAGVSSGVIAYSIQVLALLVCGIWTIARHDRIPARVFVIMAGAVLVTIGVAMVVARDNFANQLTYADLANYLWIIAPLFIVGGVGLIASELRAARRAASSRVLLAFACIAAIDCGFLVATFTTSHTWTGVLCYGLMSVVLLIAAPRLSVWSEAPVLFASMAAVAAIGDLALASLDRLGGDRLFPSFTLLHPVGALGVAYISMALALTLYPRGVVAPRLTAALALSGAAVAGVGIVAQAGAPTVTPEELLGFAAIDQVSPSLTGMLVIIACSGIVLLHVVRPATRVLSQAFVALAALLIGFLALNALAYMEASPDALAVLGPSAMRQHAVIAVGSLAVALAITGISRLFSAPIGDRLFGAVIAIGVLAWIRTTFADETLVYLIGKGYSATWLATHDTVQDAMAAMSLLIVAAAGGAAVLFLRTVTLPLDEIMRAITRARAGEPRAQAYVDGADEIGLLARAFNQLTRELADQSDLNERVALHDRLTDLPNRALFSQRLERMVRSGGPFTLLYLDLDRFKEINDAFGQDAGDDLLRELAQRLAGQFTSADTLARFGGDEFALLLPDTGDLTVAMSAAELVRSTLVRPFRLSGNDVFVEASIGVVGFPTDGADAETLLRRADIAMYDAKRSGKGLSAYAPENDPQNQKRLELMSDLRRSIAQRELRLHFQPQIRLRSGGACASVEALVRWKHPVRGMVAPGDFIPLAEESGFINELTLWVIREATAAVASLRKPGRALHLALNVSARDLHFPGLVDAVDTALRTTRLEPNALTIEITETAVMADTRRSLDTLARLSALGVRLSIDDFGAGYSSLAYLRRLPVNELKIDRMFVADMLANASSDAIVGSVIQLGHSLGLSLVAEGVEDAGTQDALRARHCDLAQGYHIARPMPLADLRAWLAQHEDKIEVETAAD